MREYRWYSLFVFMRTFVRTFFENFGSAITEHGESLVIKLSDELRAVFGQDVLRLSFDPQFVDESTELVTHGSYVANTIIDFLGDRGIKVVSRLPELFNPNREELRTSITVLNAHIQGMKLKNERNVDVLFNFKCTFLSDEKSEVIYHMGVDQRGTVFDAQSYYTADVMGDVRPIETPKGAIDLTKKDLELRFRECLRKASDLAQARGRSLQEDILKRLHRNVLRIKGYYGAQIDELHRNQPGYEEKRLHLQREYDHKLKEEIDNHRLRIVLKLLSYQVVERSEIEVTLSLRAEASEPLHVQVIYDCYTGSIDYGQCPSCGNPMSEIVVTGEGHISCRQCVTACSSCGREQRRNLMHQVCNVCNQPVCDDCVQTCSQCGVAVCSEHGTVCDVGHEVVCTRCVRLCSVCQKKLCQDHSFECHATQRPICHEHRRICRKCRKVFSSEFVQRTTEQLCPSCATPFTQTSASSSS